MEVKTLRVPLHVEEGQQPAGFRVLVVHHRFVVEFHHWDVELLKPVFLQFPAGHPNFTETTQVGCVLMSDRDEVIGVAGHGIVQWVSVEHDRAAIWDAQAEESELRLERQRLVRDDASVAGEWPHGIHVHLSEGIGVRNSQINDGLGPGKIGVGPPLPLDNHSHRG